jgi:hypothetical protein
MSAVATKDHLIKMLNGANDVHELVTVCETILIPVLTQTEGFWIELTYCYKASEIAKRAQDEVERYMDTCQHHKTHEMLAKLRDKLRLLVERYHHLQHVNDNPVVEHCNAG